MQDRRPSGFFRGLLWMGAVVGVTAMVSVSGCMESMFYVPTRERTPASLGPAGTEHLRFASEDGTMLSAWFVPPRGVDPPYAAVLHLHGNAGSIRSHAFFSEHLPPAGFGVLILDYRGYGESGGSARRRGPLIADANAALDVLLAREDVDPARVALFGQSLGGAIALLLAEERTEIKAIVLESPFACFRDIAADVLGGGIMARSLARVFISRGRSPEEAAAEINRPMLIIHGDADRIIPPHHGARIADAAGSAEWHLLSGGDHNTLRATHPESDRLQIEFLRRHIGE